ncbi:hypothetical protein N0V90_012480 [Kalmusia sp. IMI 367209]|nr:hypothetical protein N0V90_012480 [Kalmusia sp. IMI 367209]
MLLDHVVQTFSVQDLDARLVQLQELDITVQHFLRTLMAQAGMGRKSCQAVTMTIRGLFALHWHILDLSSAQITRREQALEDWQKSHIALDSITKIVLDVVDAVESGNTSSSICVAPSYSFVVRAALEHVYKKKGWKQVDWLKEAEERLRLTLHFLHQDEGIAIQAARSPTLYEYQSTP